MAILAQLQRLFSPRADKMLAQHLYMALVEQARNPVFYTVLGVPDTLDGRFDLIVLHMHLVLQRLRQGEAGDPMLHHASRQLIEYYIADMDRSLREMGVGDTGVKYRVQKMASAFYGRLNAYEAAEADASRWPESLRRNVYRNCDEPSDVQVSALVNYISQSQQSLAAIKNDNISGETLKFAELAEE